MTGKIPHDFPFPDYDPKTRADVLHTCIKMNNYFRAHDMILISVSGGSDSDCIVHLVCKYFPEYLSKCKFVFVNTGLEYDATKRHLCDLEKCYGIKIDRIKGKSVVTAIKEYGVPILNKSRSEDIYYYMQGKGWAIERIDGGSKAGTRYAYTPNMVDMIHYARDNGIKISPRCCTYSKKQPIKKYMRDNNIDLNVTGERKAEGGQRAAKHKSCFEEHKNGEHKYMPLWWWSDETKSDFKAKEGIRYSDCYEVYGMKRTGCCGCPFNLNIADDLQAMYKHEPKLYNAVMAVFGQAYELTDRFNCRRKKCLPERGEK
jgi:3'-phosphoadenosine 5'-phosphosulfate sulfotransferase (PAPS reductase)/FAD synthetase